MKHYIELYRRELLDNIMPFWVKHTMDKTNGGYYNSLTREGIVYGTEKYMWIQGRSVWTFSTFYDKISPETAWLKMAEHGADFMIRHGRDRNGYWYFAVSEIGVPLGPSSDIFTSCFACLGFAALYRIMPKAEYREIALSAFHLIREEKLRAGSAIEGVERRLALPMILCNLCLELEHIIGWEQVKYVTLPIIHEILTDFLDPDSGLLCEYPNTDVGKDGIEGIVINPGHVVEAAWFIIDLAVRLNDNALIIKSKEIVVRALELGWDYEFGGIFACIDSDGHPIPGRNGDLKFWWPHAEALIALAKCSSLTGDLRCKDWFEKVHQYAWEKFKDDEYPEWYGYLDRRGNPLRTVKGDIWKGCFHLPRAMFQVWKTFENIA